MIQNDIKFKPIKTLLSGFLVFCICVAFLLFGIVVMDNSGYELVIIYGCTIFLFGISVFVVYLYFTKYIMFTNNGIEHNYTVYITINGEQLLSPGVQTIDYKNIKDYRVIHTKNSTKNTIIPLTFYMADDTEVEIMLHYYSKRQIKKMKELLNKNIHIS